MTMTISFALIMLLMMMMKNPISLMVTIIMQTLWVSIFTNMNKELFWLGYMLILIFLGGMLIIFTYICSLASNEKFKMTKMTPFVLVILMSSMISPNPIFHNMNENLFSNINNMFSSNWKITMLLLLYLLLALLVITNLTEFKSGPLRPNIWFFK